MKEWLSARFKPWKEKAPTLGVVALAAFVVASTAFHHKAVPDATGMGTLVESRESQYNNIYVYKNGTYIFMTFGYNARLYTESAYNTADEMELPVPYTQLMTASLDYPKRLHSVLEIGFGGGRTAWYLHRTLPDMEITTVDLDPVVIGLALKHFGLREEPNFRIVAQDGRTFLMASPDHYDIILIDAYRGPFVPFHLLTREFYQLVKAHLSEGGVVAQNIEPSTMLFDSAIKTMQSVFPQIDLYNTPGNTVAIAYDGEPRQPDLLMKAAEERQEATHFRYALPKLLGERQPFTGHDILSGDAKVLTDDFAPVETLKSIEKHNRKWPVH